jgi:phosphoglycolate phosphatase-like HAD superfamily hydrolase
MNPRAVRFDLDGTLADPQPGIGRCIRHALTALFPPSPPDGDVDGW